MSIKVEIGQYRPVSKESVLRATFSLCIIEPNMEKILECKYFVQGDNRWFAMPTKEIKYTDGRKTEYIPYVSYGRKEYGEELKASVLEALKQFDKPQESHGQATNQAAARKAHPLSGDPSIGW